MHFYRHLFTVHYRRKLGLLIAKLGKRVTAYGYRVGGIVTTEMVAAQIFDTSKTTVTPLDDYLQLPDAA